MKEKEIIENIKRKTGYSDKDTAKLLKATGIAVGNTLYEGRTAVFPGLGRFSAKIRDEEIKRDDEGQNILYPPFVEINFNTAESLVSKLKNRGKDGHQ